MSENYKLYGAPLSLYTGKARAYLKFKQLPYEEVFSSIKVYKNIIVPNTGVRFIPVVETPNNEFIQDTTVIMETLEDRHPERTITPDSALLNLISEVLQIWGDEWLLIPAMHYRWNHDNFPFIYEEFGRVVTPNMPAFVRRFVGKKIGAKFKGFVPMLGITTKTIPAIENWYENHVLKELDAHFSEHDYLLGGRPCAGDFGLIGPLYAHLYRDPAPGKLMKQKAPNVAKWVERMNNPPDDIGQWLNVDELPETLIRLLQRIFSEFWPVLISTVEKTQLWISSHPQEREVPRTIGQHTYRIGDVSEQRAILTFHQWKFQRVQEAFQALTEHEQSALADLMKQHFQLRIESVDIDNNVVRENNKLVVKGR
ncbi:MAG: hypothetical protein Alis3KO_26040 [Aliiglaciecola sp.]|uniref:glutathione S-transferase family protein n=1 Tax=Aliiglaciecola sp. M165 TaxID=2593649 RepID=UPI00117C0202|nr:glutathione S-transferase family protein [Aliiglaciecola sp. M165]TRY30753.1 glutathione S-transferase family protein [Aliiglaciecola sp. M165]